MHPSQAFSGFWKLYLGRGLLTLPSHLVGIFLPILVYTVVGEVSAVFIYYIIGHISYALLLPLGVAFLERVGYRVSMAYATIWNTCFFTALFAVATLATTHGTTIFLLGVSLLCLVLFRLLFWMPYHVEVAKLTETKNRATAISLILTLVTLAGVIGPILGGWIIDGWGFGLLLIIVAATSILAFIPFYLLPRANERFEWSYRRTWRELVSKKHRGLVLAMFANGAENVVGIAVWPVFIFLLLDGDFVAVGAISSLIVAATIVLQLSAGSYLDRIRGRGNMLHVGSVLSALGWVAKIFVVTAYQIFAAGLYHNFARIFTNTPLDAMYYDLAADSGHYIDEITVLREIAIQLGKVASLAVVLTLSLFVALQWTFLIAAFAALLLNALYSEHAVHRA
jgi:YQGE family putative transporter